MERNIKWKIAQAAEIRWWQRYLKRKTKAEYLDWKRDYWLELLSKLGLRMLPGDNVLDAGCGPAGIYIAFESQKVVALDPLLDSYEERLDHFNKKDYPYVEFLNMPLEEFNTEGKFEKVFCLNAINHVSDLEKSIATIINATKENGDLVVSVDAHNFPLLKHIFKILPGDILHPHQYELKDYKQFFNHSELDLHQTLLYKKEFIFNYFILHFKKK